MGWNPIEEAKDTVEETTGIDVAEAGKLMGANTMLGASKMGLDVGKKALSKGAEEARSAAKSAQEEIIGPIADAIESGWQSATDEIQSGYESIVDEGLKPALEAHQDVLGGMFGNLDDQIQDYREEQKIQRQEREDIGQKRAKIAREQWEDYKYRFRPKEKELMNIAMDQGMYANSDQEAIDTAMSEVGSSFDTSRGVEARRRSRYGITDARSEASKRRSGLAETAAKVGSANTARAREDRRERGALTGGLSQAKKGMSV